MCGEHMADRIAANPEQGLSPRVRGTHRGDDDDDGVRGIIPACAGNTIRRHAVARRRRDHPRVCGEHVIGGQYRSAGEGSSPRVRGTRHRWPIPFGRRGIIPACAGNTACVWRGPRRPRDHPRVCGEHPEVDGLYLSHLGSSPRVRGTRAAG